VPEFNVAHNDGRALVTFDGSLTAELVPKLQPALKAALDGGLGEMVFDLAGVGMLDSSGMGLLIATSNSLSSRKGAIRVINASADILRLLQSMRLATRLNVSGQTE
jgi:anti-anti-sigma factor